MGNIQQPRQPLPNVRGKNKTRRNHLKGFAAVLVAISSFLLASQFICFNLPKSVSTLDLPALDRKLEDIKKQGSNFDFVFLGSSRVFRGINPAEIDAQASKQGCIIKTYNFGIAGLSMLEQKYILERLHESGIGIDTVVFEPYSITLRDFDNYISDRRRFFYNWGNLAGLLLDQNTMPDNIKRKVRRERLSYLLYAFMREQTGVGRLSYLLFPTQSTSRGTWDSPILRGYRPLDEESAKKFIMRKRHFVRHVGKFQEEVKKAAINPGARISSGNRFELVLDVADTIRDMKIEPAVIFMPKPAYIRHSRNLEDRLTSKTTEVLPIINMNKPEYYSDLFKTDNFFDSSHLNAHGAMVLAGLLAPRLCALQARN